MRAAITSSTLLICILLMILTHCTIISNNVREKEVNTGLNNAMEYAYDKMINSYMNSGSLSEDELISNLMMEFCKILQARLGSDGELNVELLYADINTGTFQIRVTEYFNYPFMGKVGKCMFEKTYSVY